MWLSLEVAVTWQVVSDPANKIKLIPSCLLSILLQIKLLQDYNVKQKWFTTVKPETAVLLTPTLLTAVA